MKTNTQKYKLIYNPNAGKKRQILGGETPPTLEEIKALFDKYQMSVDYEPTKRPKHATEIARKSLNKGYAAIIASGGDGTIGEVANGLVNTDATLGILPLGTYMNTARMLSIPRDFEKAIMLMKIGRTRKIDVGEVKKINGEKLSEPYYFVENVGIGIEAELQEHFIGLLEKKQLDHLLEIPKAMFNEYEGDVVLHLDNKKITTQARLITISNGPMTGSSLKLAPDAKLNDHFLTVSLFKMGRKDLIQHFYDLLKQNKVDEKNIERYTVKRVRVITKDHRPIHADARLFGETPAECAIVPNALNVICGFPDQDSALVKRTLLDP